MRNIKLTIAYDGTDFHGWQIQPGQATIQGHLMDIARQITQENVTVHGAGRTDAGVHANGQVAHFHTESRLMPEEFRRAFNALLPATIRVLEVEEAGLDFHGRHSTVEKVYSYHIFRGPVVPPLIHRRVLHYPGSLDERAMVEAAPIFEGEHDFTFFSSAAGGEEDDEPNPKRTIISSGIWAAKISDSLDWQDAEVGVHVPENYKLIYTVCGRSFLRYMVRKLAGTLLEVGRGKLQPDKILELFQIRDRSRTAVTLPPHGLMLDRIEYK